MYVTFQKFLMSLRNLLPRAYFILILQDIEILQPINTNFFFFNFTFSSQGVCVPSNSIVCKPSSHAINTAIYGKGVDLEIFLTFFKKNFVSPS